MNAAATIAKIRPIRPIPVFGAYTVIGLHRAFQAALTRRHAMRWPVVQMAFAFFKG